MLRTVILLIATIVLSNVASAATTPPETCESHPNDCPQLMAKYVYSSLTCPDISSKCSEFYIPALIPAALDCEGFDHGGGIECLASPESSQDPLTYSFSSSNPQVMAFSQSGSYQLFTCSQARLTTITVVVQDRYGRSSQASVQIMCTKPRNTSNGNLPQ